MGTVDLGRNIKRFRVEAKLPIKTVAKEIGVTIQALYRYERGDREPSVAIVSAIARVLGRRVYEFYEEEDDGEE